MGVTLKTATDYATGKRAADPARLRLLEMVIGKKVIPQDVPLWFDPDTSMLRTDTGHGFSVNELDQYGWLRRNQNSTIALLKEKVAAQAAELATLREQLDKLTQVETLPANVIPFPTHNKKDLPL